MVLGEYRKILNFENVSPTLCRGLLQKKGKFCQMYVDLLPIVNL